MKSSNFILLATLLVCLSLNAQGQTENSKVYDYIICHFNLPSERNGLTESSFRIAPRINIRRWETKTEIILDLHKIQSTPSNPDPGYRYSYNYMGKQYRNEDVGYDLFESVRATNLTYEVTVSHGSQSWTKKVDGMTNMFGPVDKDAKASDVHVFVKVVNVMFSGTGPIENKIREILKSQTTASNTTSNRAVPDNANKSPGQVSTGQDQAGSNTPSITKERPASDVLPGGQGDYNGNIESSPNNRKHDIGKGEDGKSYRKDKNGDYIEISSDEYQSLKSANAQMASRTTNPGAGPVQNAPTSPTIGMPENTSGNDPLANYNYSNSSNSSAAVQIMNSAAPLINQWANQMQANREREEQAEANRLEIIAQVEREEAKKRAEKGQLAASRKALLEKFPDGKTPLSYQVKDASKVYFFTYSYKASSLEGSAPELFISNVFPVAKYGDGSWPFKNNLLENIAKSAKGLDLILSGYYLDKTTADQQQQLFINEANRYGFIINDIFYMGKKPTESADAKTDFWGNKKEADQKQITEIDSIQDKTNPKVVLDFWGNPMKEAEQTKNKQAQENKDPKAKVVLDFWGNPIKE